MKMGRSLRRACDLVGMSRSGFAYQRRTKEDPELIARIKRIAGRYKRFGYRRTWAILRREGIVVNHKKVHRIRKSLGLTLPRRKARKPRPGTAQTPCQAASANHVWTYDFVFDSLADGRQLKLLTVVDEFTRICLKIEVGVSIRAKSVITILEALFHEYGRPQFLRSDNGPEFIAKQLRAWLKENGSQTIYIDPGSPWQNAFCESFNGKLRDECLNMSVFYTRAEAKFLIEEFRRFYNNERPHSSLNYLTPIEFRDSALITGSRKGAELALCGQV
jgi:putative transposase